MIKDNKNKNKKQELKYVISIEPKSYKHFFFINKHFNNCNLKFNYTKFYTSRGKHCIVVRTDDNKSDVIAVCVITDTKNFINIDYTVVDEKYRGKGINKSIIEFVENIAIDSNIGRLTANIRNSNESSLLSFTRNGFIPEEKTETYKNGDIKVFVSKYLELKDDDHFTCDCGGDDFWFFWNRVRCKKCLSEYRETTFISKLIQFKTPFVRNKWVRKFNYDSNTYEDWTKKVEYKYTYVPLINNTDKKDNSKLEDTEN